MSRQAHDILVAAPERWDEACFAVPAVRALIASGLGVGIMCPPQQQAFWQTIAELEVIALAPHPKTIVTAIAGSWQAAMLWEEGAFAKASKKAGIPRRVGPAEGKLAKLLTHPIPIRPGPPEHRVQFYLQPVAEMGIDTAKPEFFTPAIAGSNRIANSILLSPDSDFGSSHEWPIEKWHELVQSLLDQQIPLTITCFSNGRGLGQKVAGQAGGQVAIHDIGDWSHLLPFLTTQSILIAADGSLPHLASHAGVNCITLFGPNDPAWKRPLGKRHTILRRHVECAPCLLSKCPLDLRCQRELDGETVIQAVSKALNASGHDWAPFASFVQPPNET